VQDQFTIGARHFAPRPCGSSTTTFGEETTWNAEFGMSFGRRTRVALSGGKAFRRPDATDRFGFGGNPDLQPEISEQYELSIRQQLGNHHQLTLAAFDNKIGDLINYVVTDFTTFEAATRTSTAPASRAWNWATASRPKVGRRAPNSRCRIRAMRPLTSGCCAVHANR
jgi:outer membrane receptor protein involved in Fe transport